MMPYLIDTAEDFQAWREGNDWFVGSEHQTLCQIVPPLEADYTPEKFQEIMEYEANAIASALTTRREKLAARQRLESGLGK